MEFIGYASLIVAIGLIPVTVHFHSLYSDKIDSYRKKERESILNELSRYTTERVEMLTKSHPSTLTQFPKELYRNLLIDIQTKQLDFGERLRIIEQPRWWLKDAVNALLLAIIVFFVAGLITYTEYEVYTYGIAIVGTIAVFYALNRIRQIFSRLT